MQLIISTSQTKIRTSPSLPLPRSPADLRIEKTGLPGVRHGCDHPSGLVMRQLGSEAFVCVEGPALPLLVSGKALSVTLQDLFASSSHQEGNEWTWNPSPFGMSDEALEFPCLLLVRELDLPTAASRFIPGCAPIRELEVLGSGGRW